MFLVLVSRYVGVTTLVQTFSAFYRPLRMRKATVSFVISTYLSAHIRATAHIGGTRIPPIFVEFLLDCLNVYRFICKYNKDNRHFARIPAYISHTVAQFMMQIHEVPCSEAKRTNGIRDRFYIRC